MKRGVMFFGGLLFCVTGFLVPACPAQDNCQKLKNLSLPDATVTSAETVPAGNFKLPPGLIPSIDLPGFCRVRAEIKPSSDSLIKMEVWMPMENWNQRYLQVGNGGLGGAINVFLLASALKQGFAVAATDDGHEALPTDGSWALGHPEKIKDFGYRAVHETTLKAKLILNAFYGKPQRYAYFNGCSEGGREALMEAQRYPEDFNGILAGAPAHYWTQLMAVFAWNAQALTSPGSFPSEAKRQAIQSAAIAACGTQNSVSDDFIKDPLNCRFDPAHLLCQTADSGSCLTQPQVEAMKRIYGGPKVPSSGKSISPGYEPGAEAQAGLPGISFSSYVFGTGPGASLDASFATSFYASFVFEDPKWTVAHLDFDKDITATETRVGALLNASDPNLSPFRTHGGKLIQYHGWNDGSPPPRHSVQYYESVVARMGSLDKTQEFYRLFMAPGMMHCGQGDGPANFGNYLDLAPSMESSRNILLALEDWVEKGISPKEIIATKYKDDNPAGGIKMTRPLCPYPQKATWNGQGDTSDGRNWTCGTTDSFKK